MPEEEQDEKPQARKFPVKLLVKLLPFIIIAVLAGGGVAYGVRQKPEILGLSKGQVQLQAEADKLVSEVEKLIALPSDEKPTIATITDVDKLKDQPFFNNAQNGDKVLIYTNAKKAILYRPGEKRILEVGAVNINQADQTGGQTASPSPSATATPTPTPTPTQKSE